MAVTDRVLSVPAYAKVNLSLEVTGRRGDGFHNLVSVMQLVDLHDTLTFAPADRITLDVDDAALASEGESNLVLRAAHLLREAAGVNSGARITLQKRIPTSAGLGGGSSDAATTLMALSRMWGATLSHAELLALGANVGSDVPFFLDGQPLLLVEGRGEVLQNAPPQAAQPFLVVLVCPEYNVPAKTARLYADLTLQDYSDGAATRSLLEKMGRGESILEQPLCNSFAQAAMQVFAGLAAVRMRMLEAGAPNVHLSGSGPTLYALYPADAESMAHSLRSALQSGGLRSFVTRSITAAGQPVW